MLGISGFIISDKFHLDNVPNIKQINPDVKKIYKYADSCLQAEHYSLNLFNNECIDNENFLIMVEGCCYNPDELKQLFSTNISQFPEFILWAYKNNQLKNFLNKMDGCFHGVLYDKGTKRIILFSDRYGMNPLYYYCKNGEFAFSPVIDYFLKLESIDKEVDEQSFGCFLKFGHLLGNNTWLKNVKSIKPATILTFDTTNKNMVQEYYWTFAEVKKSDLSLDEAVDRVYNLFKNAIKKQVNINLKPCIGLSAGYDSRLILAAMREVIPEYKPYTYTFGVKNCRDIHTAKKVAKIAGVELDELIFNFDDWFEKRIDKLCGFGCAHQILDLHGCEFQEYISKKSQCMVSGYLGDTVLGDGYISSFPKEYFNRRPDKEIAMQQWGKHYMLSNYQDEYFNIENPLPLRWMNRGKNCINMSLTICYAYMNIAHPFFDNKLIELISSLPNEYLDKHLLYKKLVLKYYPKYFKTIPRNSGKLFFFRKDFKYRINKIKNIIRKKMEKCHILPEIVANYTDYDSWIKVPSLSKYLCDLLNYEGSQYSKYTSCDKQKLLLSHLKGEVNAASDILSIASAEIYLRHIADISKKGNQ